MVIYLQKLMNCVLIGKGDKRNSNPPPLPPKNIYEQYQRAINVKSSTGSVIFSPFYQLPIETFLFCVSGSVCGFL